MKNKNKQKHEQENKTTQHYQPIIHRSTFQIATLSPIPEFISVYSFRTLEYVIRIMWKWDPY